MQIVIDENIGPNRAIIIHHRSSHVNKVDIRLSKGPLLDKLVGLGSFGQKIFPLDRRFDGHKINLCIRQFFFHFCVKILETRQHGNGLNFVLGDIIIPFINEDTFRLVREDEPVSKVRKSNAEAQRRRGKSLVISNSALSVPLRLILKCPYETA
jgi:hypothetical protein